MVRGRGYSPRGGSFRGGRGSHPWSGGGFNNRGPRDRYNSFDSGYDKPRYSERFRDDYAKPYRVDNYSRERHSPDRKRPRNEGRSRHEYGGGAGSSYDSYGSDRRAYGGDRDRNFQSPRKEEFRRPPPPPSPRGGGRGRLSSRGMRGMRRDRGIGLAPRRRLADRSYTIRKRGVIGGGEYGRRSTKMIRIRSSLMRRRRMLVSSDKESSDEAEEDDAEKEVKKEEETDETKATDEASKEGDDVEVKEEKEDGAEGEKPKEKKTESPEKKAPTRTFVTLICPQCNIKVPTFRRYEAHLDGKTHLFAMRKVAAKQRSILAQMRQAQRNAQNELEKSGEAITDHTVFCPLCKLNYKQERAVHQATAAHKNMKKFLAPKCKVCKIDFKSPMVYEHHLCSVDHLKRKSRLEKAGENEEDNLEEFTTIDSVGEVGDDKEGSAEEKEREEKRKKRVSVGIEQIKRVEAYYCDLCRMFLPRGTENEYPDIIAGHCRKRFHMARYIRFKESDNLKKRAEKLQRKETAEKEKLKEEEEGGKTEDGSKEQSQEGEEMETDEVKDADATKAADDDKLWDAVDKDLGELLEETDGREDDDDEERANGERYDRFKSAEVNGEGDEAEETEATPDNSEEAKN